MYKWSMDRPRGIDFRRHSAHWSWHCRCSDADWRPICSNTDCWGSLESSSSGAAVTVSAILAPSINQPTQLNWTQYKLKLSIWLIPATHNGWKCSKFANLSITLRIDIYNIVSAMVVTTVHKNSVKYVVGRVGSVGLLQELVQLQLLRKLKSVVDLYVVVSLRVVLKPHQLQVQDGRKRDEFDAFLRLLQTQTTQNRKALKCYELSNFCIPWINAVKISFHSIMLWHKLITLNISRNTQSLHSYQLRSHLSQKWICFLC